MFSQNNIGWTLIGDNIAYTSATKANQLAKGEIAVVDAFGNVITTSTDALGQKFRLVQGRGAGLSPRSTDLITPSGNLVYFNASRHYNPAEQVTAIGFNGTSGSIDTITNNLYFLRLNMIEVDRTGFGQANQIYGKYKSGAAVTQWQVAREVAANLNDNVRKQFERDVTAVSLFDAGSATGSGAITGTDNINVTNGSDIITEGSDAWTGTPTVGQVIALASSDIGYEVVEVIDANTVRVHMPYQGATAANAVAVSYTAASVAAVNCGIQLTGVIRNFDPTKPGLFQKVRWETQLQDFGETNISSIQGAADGKGNFQQVAKEEYFTESVFGNRYRKDHLFRATIDTDLSGATYYGCLALRWRDPHEVSAIGPQPASSKHVRLYVGDGAADSSWSATGVQAATILTILNTILGTSETYA